MGTLRFAHSTGRRRPSRGLTAPVEHLDSANYWGVVATPLRTGAVPMPGTAPISCRPRRVGDRCLRARRPARRRFFRNRRVDHLGMYQEATLMQEDGRTVLRKGTASHKSCPILLPTTTGSRALIMRAKAITSFREHSIKECRRRPRKCLIERPPDTCISAMTIGAMNMIAFTKNIIGRLESS
jgi:hypothetical protein